MRKALNESDISGHLPPFIVRDLVKAAATGDTGAINGITDRAAKTFPHLVRPRNDVAPGYAPSAQRRACTFLA